MEKISLLALDGFGGGAMVGAIAIVGMPRGREEKLIPASSQLRPNLRRGVLIPVRLRRLGHSG